MKKIIGALFGLFIASGVCAQPAPSFIPGCVYLASTITLSNLQTTSWHCDINGKLITTGTISGTQSGANTWTTTQTFAPTSNVTAVVINGADGGNTSGTRNVAEIITGGTKLYDVGLIINKPTHDAYSALDVNLLSTNGGGHGTRWFTNFSGTRVMAAEVTNNATMASGNGLFSGTHSSSSTPEDDAFVYPATWDAPNLAVWSDTAIAFQARPSSAASAVIASFLDKDGNYTGVFQADSSHEWGSVSTFQGTIATTVLTVTVAPTVGSLAVGQKLYGVGVTNNTYIVSLGTGTGGTGTYNLNNSMTVSSAIHMSVMDAAFGREGPSSLRVGFTDNAIPIASSIGFQNGSGTNITAAVSAGIIGPLGTGTGTNGDIIFQTGVKVGSGSGAPVKTTALTIKGETQAVIAPTLQATTLALGGATISTNEIAGPNWNIRSSDGKFTNAGAINAGSLSLPTSSMGGGGAGFISVVNSGVFAFSSNASGIGSAFANLDGFINRQNVGIIGIGTTATNTLGQINLANIIATGTITHTALGFTNKTTGAGVQTFTNSPCASLTVANWIAVSISGVAATAYIPACS